MPDLVQQFEARVQAAADAIADGNAELALREAGAAQALAAAIPDGGRNGTQMSLARETLERVIRNAERMKARASGMRDTRVTYARERGLSTPQPGVFD